MWELALMAEETTVLSPAEWILYREPVLGNKGKDIRRCKQVNQLSFVHVFVGRDSQYCGTVS